MNEWFYHQEYHLNGVNTVIRILISLKARSHNWDFINYEEFVIICFGWYII